LKIQQKTLIVALLCLLLAHTTTAQVNKFAKSLSVEAMRQDLYFLAGEQCAGRGTDQAGLQVAAEYIAKQMRTAGINPPKITQYNGTTTTTDYFQKVPLTKKGIESMNLSVNGKNYKAYSEFYADKNIVSANITADEIVFLGFGIDDKNYTDLTINIENKVVLIFEGEPTKKGISWLTKSNKKSRYAANFRAKVRELKKKNPKAIICAGASISNNINQYGSYLSAPTYDVDDAKAEKSAAETIPVINITPETAKNLVANYAKILKKINQKGKPKTFTFRANMAFGIETFEKQVISQNIAGYIKGTEKPDEVLVISAHYDHLGSNEKSTYFGADDNGSGTTMVLNLMRVFAKTIGTELAPKRSVLFLFMTGEEKGLLGSEYYTYNPIFPLENTIADLNTDMVGRIDDAHANNPNYVYVIGADKLSTELNEINEAANDNVGLELDYTYNDENDPNQFYYRSDHYNFAKNGIPVIFYFNGVHADYHQPTDTPDKINYEKMQKIGTLVFYTATDLLNRPNRPTIDKKTEKSEK
jgi:hypothetical protein